MGEHGEEAPARRDRSWGSWGRDAWVCKPDSPQETPLRSPAPLGVQHSATTRQRDFGVGVGRRGGTEEETVACRYNRCPQNTYSCKELKNQAVLQETLNRVY